MATENKKLVIAIDGFSSCGKSTFAKLVAKKLDYIYIDTGAMYRAVTLFALQNKLVNNGVVDVETLIKKLPSVDIAFKFNPETNQNEVNLDGKSVEKHIRTLEVSNAVSPVSVIPEVRTKMVILQQQMGTVGGIVMDGRDIGTTVFPNADLKIFMTADSGARAQRRYKELTEKGDTVSFDEIKNNIETRDHIDQNRAVSPLQQASDALVLDNTYMTVEEQMVWVELKLKVKS